MFLITALLIGTLLETLAYGSYVALFSKHLQILVARRKKIPSKPLSFLVVVSCGFFAITTVTVASDLTFISNIFTSHPSSTINFSGYARKDGINEFSQILSIMLSDLFLLYRSYVLYSTQLRVVVLPLLTFLSEVGFGIWAMVTFEGIDIKEIDPWSNRPLQRLSLGETIFGFVAFATNVICTSLIVFRLWRTHHEMVQYDVQTSRSMSTLFRIGFVILNSAAVYIVWMIAAFATSITSSLVYQIITPSFSCITALIFSSIIVRAPSSTPTSVTEMTTISFSHPPVQSTTSFSGSGRNARKLVFAQRSTRDESESSLSSRHGPQTEVERNSLTEA
ncbi:hypothetical protein F5878DRAFT_627059 [Lentinula raphanica]|uniref:Uncharacterized protein n=1 Tax=Lentinula raphanica TaxID=153919 RepID=A0AA38P3T9_9AGAR|nr:hypothetical protein F5880DRAFT_863210 [Lentinula raphanica]KAJ3835764.1 hypothetical protein F5878DRAFT_627059 [Lentinula raphanica]